jgi:putative transposase
VFHVFNRAAKRSALFHSPADYRQLERVLVEACEQVPMRILAYCAMPNHWHLLVWPREDGHLSAFMRWATTTHAVRWRMDRDTVGEGAVYQGRYRAVPVQDDRHLLIVARYIERNPVRAGLARRAADWPWSSAGAGRPVFDRPPLSEWPLPRPADWAESLETDDDGASLDKVRTSLRRAIPFGDALWQDVLAERLGRKPGRLRGRPRARTDRRN